MADLRAIRFLLPAAGYNAGEVAGFSPEVAEHYVTTGQAELYVIESTPAAPPSPAREPDPKGMDAPPADKQVRQTTKPGRAKPRTK